MITPVNKLDTYTTDATTPRVIKKTLGKDDFLKLLITQMQFQDPLKPMENTEMTAQLTQFSSLDQLTSINDGMQKMSDNQGSLTGVQSVNFIGKEITATGNKVYMTNGTSASAIDYNLGNAVSGMNVSITDKDGKIIRNIKVGPQDAGTHSISWDGKDSFGNQVSEGEYTFSVTAKDLKGNSADISTNISGTVTGVIFDNKVPYLMVGGTRVAISDVSQVKEVSK